MTVTIAIPVRDGGEDLRRALASVSVQRLDGNVELLVCDSGSRDGSRGVAREYGAEVIEIAPEQFSHGRVRNLLMERSRGDHVAFLTQDAMPADEQWLARLLRGFSLEPDVGLVFGPYVPRPEAAPMVSREVTEWFRGLSPHGTPRIDRLSPAERSIPVSALLGPRGYFTDANGCISRQAWEKVPFRAVPYAEDHVLAHDMLRAGYAKVYLPEAAVIHSHDYSPSDWLRRSFDEARALYEVYGFVEPLEIRRTGLKVWGLVGADWRWARAAGTVGSSPVAHGIMMAGSLYLHLLRTAGAVLGSRAHRLPDGLVRRLSLEGRGR